MRVAYLTGRSYRGEPMPLGAVPKLERVSRDLIVAAGRRRGARFDIRYWDDPGLADDGYAAAVIRSCWDYHQRVDAFIARLTVLEAAGLRVLNSAEIVRWNARKTYLRALEAIAIDTIWAEHADAATVANAFEVLDAAEIIVKPQIGAGSIGTLRLRRNSWSEADLMGGSEGPAMIQPFLKSIETEGERSLFWFGEDYSHAVRKTPSRGEWRANMPGQTQFLADTPPKAALAVAEAARAALPQGALYARIDLVLGNDERWRVIEIEAIEPYLFLDFAPEAADGFVAALSRALSG
jgi:glutathione synthase/RimK-type ligase-like ATP-grasp enzyme